MRIALIDNNDNVLASWDTATLVRQVVTEGAKRIDGFPVLRRKRLELALEVAVSRALTRLATQATRARVR